jgi:hypothetical protein
VVREGVGAGGEMNQALYAHMNNKKEKKKKNVVKERSFVKMQRPGWVWWSMSLIPAIWEAR